MSSKKLSVRFPISIKLISIVSVLIILSLGAITLLVSYFVTEDVRITAENNNFDANFRSATTVQSNLTTLRSNVLLLLDLINHGDKADEEKRAEELKISFFDRNPEIGAISLFKKDSTGKDFQTRLRLVNEPFFNKYGVKESGLDLLISAETEALRRAFYGESTVLNATPFFNYSTFAIISSWYNEGELEAFLIFSSCDDLIQGLGQSSTSVSYLINNRSDIVVHPDYSYMQETKNIADSPLVIQMRSNNDESRQVLFTGHDGREYFGAYRKLSIADLGLLTTVESNLVFENVRATTLRNVYLTFAVLFIAVLFVWIYSFSFSRPIKKLTLATEEISRGNYEIQLSPRGHDEISVLTKAFDGMREGLIERRNLMNSFSRFVNKVVAEKASRGELSVTGEGKDVTVFFSDIRSFTAISESLTPEEVVGFLNEYLSLMVPCVNKTFGNVDKFIGDAVMAVWGTPTTSGNTARDALQCVGAALMMRHELRKFNKDRGGPRKPIIQIGCGINTGPVIAGQIGSSDRMEYTVIGDTVNFASRTESLNKPLHTDILITENTYKLIKDFVLVEEMPSVTVKGKSKPVKLYAVINMPMVRNIPGAGPDGPKTLAEVREMLGLDAPDLESVNLNEDEKKYKIPGQK